MSDSVPTPIVDKNGKQTTVHKKPAKLFPDRISAASLAPQVSAMQTVEYRNIQEAKAAVYAIPADAPILAGLIERERAILAPQEYDEPGSNDGWEELAVHYSRLKLFDTYLRAFETKLGNFGDHLENAARAATFIIDNQNQPFASVKDADKAIDEYLPQG